MQIERSCAFSAGFDCGKISSLRIYTSPAPLLKKGNDLLTGDPVPRRCWIQAATRLRVSATRAWKISDEIPRGIEEINGNSTIPELWNYRLFPQFSDVTAAMHTRRHSSLLLSASLLLFLTAELSCNADFMGINALCWYSPARSDTARDFENLYIYTHTHTHTHTYTRSCARIHIYICMCMYMYTGIFVSSCMCKLAYI